MVLLKEISCLLLVIASVAFVPSPISAQQDEAKIRKSRSLILEYNWPKAIKGLKRYPHVMSCQHFYATRLDGSHIIKECPDGETFDFPTLRCSKKASAKCWSDQFKPHHSKKVKKFVCPFSWGLYPDIEDCSQFFNCLNGKPYHRKCSSSSLFDKAERKCVKKSDAMCADESDVVDPGYECPYTWGFFTYAKDCSKYYECLQKNPSLRSCKRNLLFDNQKRKCLSKEKVECGARFNPYAVTTTKITSNDPLFTSVSYSEKSPSPSDSSSSEEDSSEETGKTKFTTRSKNKFSTISFKTSSEDSDSSEEDKTSKLFTQSVSTSDSDSSEEDGSTESKESTTDSKSKSTKMFTETTVRTGGTEEGTEPTGNEPLTTASESKSTKLFTDTIVTADSDGPGDDTELTRNETVTTESENETTKLLTDIVVTTNSESSKEDTESSTRNELQTTESETGLFTDTIVTANTDDPGDDTESTGNEPVTTESENESTKHFTDSIVTEDSDDPGDDTESTGNEELLTKVESNFVELTTQ